MIQKMLTIWSVVPLSFLNRACTSGSSWLTHCWSLAWRILNITLLPCEMNATVQIVLWLCPSLGLEWKVTFSSLLIHITLFFTCILFFLFSSVYILQCFTYGGEVVNAGYYSKIKTHGLEESILSKWPYYPKQSIDSMQSLSSYQRYFSQN